MMAGSRTGRPIGRRLVEGARVRPWSESRKRRGPGGETSLLPLLAIAPVVGGSWTRARAPEMPGTPEIPRAAEALLAVGHTDGSEDSAFSRGVGEERAKSAETYLVSKGAVADRITIVPRGAGRPACGEKTAICRAANRRATFSAAVRP